MIKKLSSDNDNDCVQICFNYIELELLCRFLENGIAGLNLSMDEHISLKEDATVVLSSLEHFRDLFE